MDITSKNLTLTTIYATCNEIAPDILQLASTYIYYTLGEYINAIWLPILVPVGLGGNMLCFLVMNMKHNRKIPCCIYMRNLAVLDSLMLCLAGLYWIKQVALLLF